MGAPLIGFRFPPLAEILTDDNSIVVTTPVSYHNEFTPVCSPLYSELESLLLNELRCLDGICLKQRNISTGLSLRRARFESLLRVLFTS